MRALVFIIPLLAACTGPGSGGVGLSPDASTGDTASTSATTADDTHAPDSAAPDSAAPDSAAPDTSEVAAPDIDEPDIDEPDIDEPDIDEPDIDEPATCRASDFAATIDGFTYEGDLTWRSPEGADLGLGGVGDDAISIVFANAQTGTFDLAGSTPGDCRRCVWFEADQGTGAASIWLAVAGTLTVSRAPDQALEVTLTDAVLAEVEGGALVADGACYGVDALALEGDIPCEPDCAGKICGGDGCGGTCGPGCEFTQTCNASQTACVGPTPSCPIVSFPSVLFPAGVQVVAAETATNIGGSTSDYVQIYVRTDAKGEFDLASGVNSSFATCEQCILLSEDDGETWFFQYRGELTVDEDTRIFDDPPVFEGEVYDVLLREVTIDPNTYVSTWVPGGRCYRIDNRYVWTD